MKKRRIAKVLLKVGALGALGMLTAVVVTLTDQAIVSYSVIIAGIATGAAIGLLLALFPKGR